MKHYTSSRFWNCFNALPPEVQALARRNTPFSSKIPRIRLCSSSMWLGVVIAALAWACITVHWGCLCPRVSNGFGLAHTPNMTSYCTDKAPMIREHDRVALTAPLPGEGLEAGDIGAVVHIYPQEQAYELEFVTLTGKTAAVVTVTANHV